MKVVSRFEANLLGILRFFLGRVPTEQALPLLVGRCPAPRCLGRAAVELVQDSLAKGCTLWLVRHGGWRPERHLRGDTVAEGRLWQRTPPGELGLTFSCHTLQLLIDLTAANPAEDTVAEWAGRLPEAELTIGDHLFRFLAYRAVREMGLAGTFRQSSFTHNALCRLAYPDEFGTESVDFAPWTAGAGAWVLEALQPELARRWLVIERSKGRITKWKKMQAVGQAQGRVLDVFLDAVEAADRRDLARFLLRCARDLLTADARSDFWVGSLEQTGTRMAERTATHQAALAFLHRLERLHQWARRAQHVGYLDEGYTASQLWKADWEEGQGESLHARAQTIIRELEPFSVSSPE